MKRAMSVAVADIDPAGAGTTNSNGVGFSEAEIVEHCATAGRLAREAVAGNDDDSPTSEALVFGSLGPLVESYRPDKILERQQGVVFYSKMVTALAPYVDSFLAETLSSTEEAMQVVEAVAMRSRRSHSILISFTVNSAGNLRSDEPVVAVLPRVLEFCEQRQVKRMYKRTNERMNYVYRFKGLEWA